MFQKYYLERPTLPNKCFCNLGIAYNEAQKLGYGARKEILKTWEVLAIVVRAYEYRTRKSKFCLDCKKIFKDCLCPWTETIKSILIEHNGTRRLKDELFPNGGRVPGRHIAEQRLSLHLQERDVQTVATALCILDPPEYRSKHLRKAMLELKPPDDVARMEAFKRHYPFHVPARTRSSKSDGDRSIMMQFSLEASSGRDVAMEALEAGAAGVASFFRQRRIGSMSITSDDSSSNANNKAKSAPRYPSESHVAHSGDGVTSLNTTIDEDPASDDESENEGEPFLDPAKSDRNEAIKRWYAQFLRDIGMVKQSIWVQKFVKNCPEEPTYRAEVSRHCEHCKQRLETGTRWCPNCPSKDRGRTCVICRIPVRGTFSMCLFCNHGGHTNHMSHWFAAKKKCPTGCGCPCLALLARETEMMMT